jgi:hypothetical protein
MKTIRCFILIASILPALLFGQKSFNDSIIKRNTIYIEIGGQGIIGSLNYDKLFRVKKKVKTSFSCGLTTFGNYTANNYDEYWGIPLSYNFLFGKRNSHLELGIGFTVFAEVYLDEYTYVTTPYPLSPTYFQGHGFYTNQVDFATYLTPKIGYRFQKPNGGFFFRVAFTPLINFANRYAGVVKNGVRYEPATHDWFIGGLDIIGSDMPWLGIALGYTIK